MVKIIFAITVAALCMNPAVGYRLPITQGDMFGNLLRNFNTLFHNRGPEVHREVRQKSNTIISAPQRSIPGKFAQLSALRMINRRPSVARSRLKQLVALSKQRSARLTNNRKVERKADRKACDHGGAQPKTSAYGATKDINDDLVIQASSQIRTNGANAGNTLTRGNGKEHSRTKIFVNKNANIIHHSKRKTSEKVYGVQTDDGLDIVNEQDTDFQEAVDSFNFSSGVLKKTGLTGKVVTKKIQHVSHSDPNGNYKELIIDNDVDEDNHDVQADNSEYAHQKQFRESVEGQFDSNRQVPASFNIPMHSDYQHVSTGYDLPVNHPASYMRQIGAQAVDQVRQVHILHQPAVMQQFMPYSSQFAQMGYGQPQPQPFQDFNQVAYPFANGNHNFAYDNYEHQFSQPVYQPQDVSPEVLGIQPDQFNQGEAYFNQQLNQHDDALRDIDNSLNQNNIIEQIPLDNLEQGFITLQDGTQMLGNIIHEGNQLDQQVVDHGNNMIDLKAEYNNYNAQQANTNNGGQNTQVISEITGVNQQQPVDMGQVQFGNAPSDALQQEPVSIPQSNFQIEQFTNEINAGPGIQMNPSNQDLNANPNTEAQEQINLHQVNIDPQTVFAGQDNIFQNASLNPNDLASLGSNLPAILNQGNDPMIEQLQNGNLLSSGTDIQNNPLAFNSVPFQQDQVPQEYTMPNEQMFNGMPDTNTSQEDQNEDEASNIQDMNMGGQMMDPMMAQAGINQMGLENQANMFNMPLDQMNMNQMMPQSMIQDGSSYQEGNQDMQGLGDYSGPNDMVLGSDYSGQDDARRLNGIVNGYINSSMKQRYVPTPNSLNRNRIIVNNRIIPLYTGAVRKPQIASNVQRQYRFLRP